MFGKRKVAHDFSFRKRMWGNNFNLLDKKDEQGIEWKIAGWKHGINKGDYLLMGLSPTITTSYKVRKIKYSGNPSDMFFAEIVFSPELREKISKGKIKLEGPKLYIRNLETL